MTQPDDVVAHDDGDLEQYAGEQVDDGWDKTDDAVPVEMVPAPEDAR